MGLPPHIGFCFPWPGEITTAGYQPFGSVSVILGVTPMRQGRDSLPGTVFPEPGKDLHLPGVDVRRVLLVLERRRDFRVPAEPGKDRREIEAAVGVVECEVLVGDRAPPDV